MCISAVQGGDLSLLALRHRLEEIVFGKPPLLPSVGQTIPKSWMQAMSFLRALRAGRNPVAAARNAVLGDVLASEGSGGMASGFSGGARPYVTMVEAEQIWIESVVPVLGPGASPQVLTDVINGTSEQLPPEMLDVANTMQDWAEAGYLTEGWAALTSTDVLGMFAEGDGLFTLNGSWNVFQSDTPENFRLVPFPLGTASELAAIATGDLPWAVPSKAKNPDLAKKYIDFITGPEASTIWIKNGQVPASVSGNEAQEVEANGLVGVSADAILQWANLVTNGTTEPFPDWATPTWYDTISKSSTSLMAGEITPQEFVDALQADYGAFTAERKASS
jgi:hypothetical protein